MFGTFVITNALRLGSPEDEHLVIETHVQVFIQWNCFCGLKVNYNFEIMGKKVEMVYFVFCAS